MDIKGVIYLLGLFLDQYCGVILEKLLENIVVGDWNQPSHVQVYTQLWIYQLLTLILWVKKKQNLIKSFYISSFLFFHSFLFSPLFLDIN